MSKAALAAGFLPSGPAGDKAKAISLIIIVLLVVVVAWMLIKRVFGGLDGILEALGLKESDADKKRRLALEAQTNNANNPESAFSPTLYKKAPAGSKLVTAAKADQLAKQIWDSVGRVWDDPESGLSAIKQLPSKAAVSFVADKFASKYQRDMIGWLQIKYDTDQQKDILLQIYDYVNQLPKY